MQIWEPSMFWQTALTLHKWVLVAQLTTARSVSSNKQKTRNKNIIRYIAIYLCFFFFVANFVTTLYHCEHRLCITLYSKREDLNYRETALKIDTFSASLKLSHIDIQRLSLPEGYVKKIQPSRQKEEKMHRLKWNTIFSDLSQSKAEARNIWYCNCKFRLKSVLLLASLDARGDC